MKALLLSVAVGATLVAPALVSADDVVFERRWNARGEPIFLHTTRPVRPTTVAVYSRDWTDRDWSIRDDDRPIDRWSLRFERRTNAQGESFFVHTDDR